MTRKSSHLDGHPHLEGRVTRALPPPPLVVFEDDDLLVVNKPAGLNTHAPSPYAGEGLFEWLRNREPRWATLAIIHRLDKETSGLMVFGKTERANKSLTNQFAKRDVTKTYFLVTDRPVKQRDFVVRSRIGRIGDRYSSQSPGRDPQQAETRFHVISAEKNTTTIEATPLTGRTHQIRVHAAESGFPILGDKLYGGTAAHRLHLRAAELLLKHPATGKDLRFKTPPTFESDPRIALRESLIDTAETTAFRLIHGAADGWPGLYVDRLGDHALTQGSHAIDPALLDFLRGPGLGIRSLYHKTLTPDVRQSAGSDLSPTHVDGDLVVGPFTVLENGLTFELSFEEGYSIGLFLDQRDNRRRFLTNYIAPGFTLFKESSQAEVLNTFAYTCSFSVCAARAGARTTSIDLSRKYLDWGRRNFQHNDITTAGHDFIYGDVFDWLRRFARKQRAFDAIILDPPTSSHSPQGFFTAEKHYGKLVTAALAVLRSGGVLLACTNAARLTPESFVKNVESAVASARRRILQQHYVPQPPDFPITRDEPAHLKTIWLRIA
jgi:23S rRNA (cytosine1962-C5)-methyltransferase